MGFAQSPSSFGQSADPSKLKWSGDLRYRFVQLREASDEARLYQQLRARLGLRAEIQEDLSAILRLATGTSAISNNQTMGDAKEPGMPRRSFGVDLAYGEWRFENSGRLWFGRSSNPFFTPGKTQLVFDGDLAFEGLSSTWNPRWSDSSAFATVGGFIISENYAAPEDSVDTALIGFEAGYVFRTEFGSWTLRAGRFHWLNIVDQLVTRIEKEAKVDAYSYPVDRVRGNSVYPNDPFAAPADRKYFYKYEFVQTNVGVEWKWKFDAVELTAFYDWVNNERAGANGNAFETGLIARYGRLQILFATAEKKSDAVIGAFTDSDFNGGGTDNKGTKISASYFLSDNSSLVFTDYRAKRGVDSVPREYSAQQLDFSLQF